MTKHKVIIIGSGFGGQTAAINLCKQGIDDFIILERRNFLGGTWCQNTYPGAAVDVQSLLYSLSFEPYPWDRMFATQTQLKAYTLHVIQKYNLEEVVKLNTTVTNLVWEEKNSHWKVFTDDGTQYTAQFVINASGPLSRPVIPAFEGQSNFQGTTFHTNQWNHDYDYSNKKVAVIGSGASAIQVIPAIADQVNELHIFQRTPHWVLPKPDFKFPSFLKKILAVPFLYKIFRYLTYWALETRVIAFKYSKFARKIFAQNKAIRFIKQSFKDPEFRKKVTPDFEIGCKRVLLSNKLFKTYQKENVSLHTKDEGIEKFTSSGIQTKTGEQIDLDLIVYATGFNAEKSIVSCEVIGKNEMTLVDFWKEFPRAYLGTSMPNFPNFFIVTGPNTGIGHTSALFIIESQMKYIIQSIQATEKKNKKAIEVNPKAENEYTAMIHREMERTVWKSGGCQSWYKNNNGYVIAMFPGFSFSYYRLANNFKADNHTFT